jgi:hypothetical protein
MVTMRSVCVCARACACVCVCEHVCVSVCEHVCVVGRRRPILSACLRCCVILALLLEPHVPPAISCVGLGRDQARFLFHNHHPIIARCVVCVWCACVRA